MAHAMPLSPPGLSGVTVAHLGHHDPDYARNRIMAKCLRRAGATVVEVVDERRFLFRTPALVSRCVRQPIDVVLVGFPSHSDVPAAGALGMVRQVPVVFDPLVSLYEMAVEDRRTATSGDLRSRRYIFQDRLGCRLSDLILLDTEAHISYFVDRFGVPRHKLRRIWVGSDDDVMFPRKRTGDERFRVLFYGSFIPLHGLEHILAAAALLETAGEEVDFTIVGTGQTFRHIRRLAAQLQVTSVRFLGPQPYRVLPSMMAESDVCLGIFGTSGKASRVIPNKVFDALAVARPVITADTPAIREALTHGEHAWLCPAGDPDALASAITTLKADEALRSSLAHHGHQLFLRRFSLAALTNDISAVMNEALCF